MKSKPRTASKTTQIIASKPDTNVQKSSISKLDTFLDSIRRNSVKTGRTYTVSLNHLTNFIKESYPDYDINTIIDAMLQNKINVYQLLDSFISYLQSIIEGITANSLSVYVAGT